MKLGSQNGSALVLTLLFIMLLTTMSTAMYLYSTKQSLFADSEYTTVAASYIADAGIEHGKALLARKDILLNTYGQNPGDNRVERDDYPVVLPMSHEIGQIETNALGERITDGKQGVGNYSLRIDAAFSEIVDFNVELIRTTGFETLKFGDVTRIHRLLPGKQLKLQVRQGIEVVNSYEFSYLNERIYFGQDAGALRYELNLSNIINPFVGDPITLELNRSEIIQESFPKRIRDAWGNKLMLFPNDDNTRNNSKLVFESTPKSGADALFFIPEPNKALATYIMEIENPSPFDQPDVTVTLFYTDSGVRTTMTICDATDWASGDKVYAMLDFSNDEGLCKYWGLDDDGVGEHQLVTDTVVTDADAIIMEVTGDIFTGGGVNITITRGIKGEVALGLRMRCEGMPDGCWFPQYPECGGSMEYQPLMTLPASQDSILYDMTAEMMNLGHKNRIKVNELYTISATGNVESANETRSLLASPASFLDYARFSSDRLQLPAGAMFGGKLYNQERIELLGKVFFYGDVMTSKTVYSPELAEFPLGDQLYENVALIEFPPLDEVLAFYSLNSDDAWVIGSAYSTDHYDLFLGNYGHVKTEVNDEFYGFDFSEAVPVYRAPTANIKKTDNFNPRTGWVPGALAPPTSIISSNFNGLVIVNGNAHVWGKLHGRSLTIMAKGDIYVEREILMGTDELDPDSVDDAMSTDQGMPVHLALVPLRQDDPGIYSGDIILSENCPRIMKVQSTLMAFAGSLVTEDTDYGSDFSDLDTDGSHQFARIRWIDPPGDYYIWEYNSDIPTSYDLNGDGRLTDSSEAAGGLPWIELGNWNETNIVPDDHLWYLLVVGSYIDGTGGGPAHFSQRGSLTGPGRNGNTRNYRYDPSIRINAPPILPLPHNTLRILEWDHAVYK